jgi:hypothetical protein
MAAIFAMLISVAMGMLFGVRLFDIILRAVIFAIVFFGLGFGLRFVINSFFPELLFTDDDSLSQDTMLESGSRIDITIDSTGEYAVPELYKSSDDSDDLGNIEDLISGVFRPRYGDEGQKTRDSGDAGIDADKEARYNDYGIVQDVSYPESDDFQDMSVFEKKEVDKPSVEKPVFTPSFGDDSGLGGLPDLDMMARAFSSVYGSSSAPMPVESVPSLPSVPSAPPAASASPQASMPSDDGFMPERGRNTGNKPQAMEGDFDPKALAQGLRTVLNKDN